MFRLLVLILFLEISYVEGLCGQALTGNSGSIQSPNYPRNYDNRAICTWSITADPGTLVTLTFSHFDVEYHSTCGYDYLLIVDGSTGALLARLCGSNGVDPITSTGNTLYIRFSSDGSGTRSGFQLTWCASTPTVGCSEELNANEGWIESPNFPNNYNVDTTCEWVIRSDQGTEITLTFAAFDLPSSDLCSGDAVIVRDGTSGSSNLLAHLCGSDDIPAFIRSSSNAMYVKFQSDESDERQGFRAQWSTAQDPATVLTGNTGTIQSLNYPNDYPNFARQAWKITSDAGTQITLLFVDFELQGGDDCPFDYLVVYDGANNAANVLLKDCGSTAPAPVTATGNVMYIEFRADEKKNDAGFIADWSTAPGCIQYLSGSSGTVETPNYPSTYSDYTQCVWIITVDPNMQVKLELPFVDVQCGEDFLEIRDGGDQFASRIDKLCGAVNPPVMVTRGNEMFLFFHSDGSGTATGFSGTWNAIPGCNQELNGTGGIIQSQNYPHNYYHRARCQWVIKTDPGTQIQLEFTSFSLQPSYLCRSDAVSIFDGEDRSASKLAKLCDNGEAPNIFISSGNAMTVRFRSDSSITAQGFQAQWGISQECSGNLTGNEGYIQSPNYPGLYPHMVTCEWVVRSDPGTKILLSLINNYLPVYSDCSLTDSITIRDGDSATSDLLAEICSSGDTDPIRSTSNVMYVKFRSNAELATKGFRAFYSTREPCNFVLTGDSGTIQSPEYPNNYPVHAHCTWLITSSPGTNLVLTFTDFDVEDTEHCRSDKLQTYDGNSIHSMSLGESCGNTLPKPVIAFSNSLFLYFTSDETGAGSGFQAEWTIFEGCGGNLDGNSGSFSSPNYPGNYHRGAWCEWVIRSDPGTQITLVFSDLEVQGDFYCNIDTVTIRDGGNVTGDLLGRFCSTSHLVPFASSGNEMYVAFRSSVSSFAGRGFQAHWSAAPACTYDVTGNTGTIQSSNYPNNYTDNANCMWKINTAPGTHIVLDFLTFDLQASQSCTDDSLAIYDGEDQYKTRLELLCGSNLPGSIISAGNHLFLHFRTDELETAYGFQIEWSIFQGCSANLTGNTGTIQSPNYPNNYPGNVLCDWTIRSDPGTNITLSFNDFDIVKTSSCSDDVVLVYDGEDDSAQPLSRMCGLGDPIPVTSTSNVMHVQFKSSSLYHDKGFQAQWSTNEGCLYELTGNSGTIQSPNYPDNYPNNILCSWVITTEVNSQAVLSFTDFDLQSSVDCSADAVSVYQLTDRRDALPILRKSHCGSTIPASVVRAASNILYITFMSDGSGTSRGFQADWSTYTGCGEELSGDNGTIKSPNFPNDYENYENCRWTITVDQGKRIKLEFISFDVENSADCVFDALRIVDTTLTELCGLRLPDPYTSSGNTLVLTFKTDGSGADSGFDIRWSVTDGY